jgi:chromosome partitioning protein
VSYIEENRKTADKPARILATVNQKGGVGKTTTAVSLAAALAEQGYKTLLIDTDPQGNAGTGVGFDKVNCDKCIYDVLLNDVPISEIIADTEFEHLYVAPATINLAGAELELVSVLSRESRLADAVKEIEQDFDFIAIDCPPSLGLLTLNGLVAAKELVIPVQCEFYAMEGVSKLLDTFRMIKSRLNADLEICGVLITMYDGRTNLASQVVEEFEKYFGEDLFETKIPRTVRISEAPGFGEPITSYDSNGKGANAYRELAKEVISRG